MGDSAARRPTGGNSCCNHDGCAAPPCWRSVLRWRSPRPRRRGRRGEHQEAPRRRDDQRDARPRARVPVHRERQRGHPRVRHAGLRRVGRLRAGSPARRRLHDATQTFIFRYYEETAPAELQQVTPNQEDYETASFQYSGSGDVTAPVQPVDVQIPPPAEPGTTSGLRGVGLRRLHRRQHRADPARLLQLRRQGGPGRGGRRFGRDHLQRGPARPHRAQRRHARRGDRGRHPGRRRLVRRRRRALRAHAGRPGDRARVHGDPRRAAPDVERPGVLRARATRTRRSSSARTWTRSPRAPASTTTAPAAPASWRSPRSSTTRSSTSKLRRQLVFAFWGAEESGLVGSEYYVGQLLRASSASTTRT